MSTTAEQWAAGAAALREAHQSGNEFSSMTVAGETFAWKSLDELQRAIEYAESKARQAATGGGAFHLARFSPL